MCYNAKIGQNQELITQVSVVLAPKAIGFSPDFIRKLTFMVIQMQILTERNKNESLELVLK